MKALGRTEIGPKIFQQEYTKAGLGQLSAARLKPHMNTSIHWSAMAADALLKINRKYRITQQQAMALIYSVTACNSPDYFRLITNRLISDENYAKVVFGHSASYIAIMVYEMIFQYKADASRTKAILPGQRHQPCGNKQGSREAISASVQNMIEKCKSLACYQDRNKSLGCKQDIKMLYWSTLRDFCKSHLKGGVFGAGPLIANKIIQIASLLGLFPFQFLLQSRIAKSTCTYKYLCGEFGLDDVNADSPILLDALSFMTQTNHLMAEGMCCKAAQEHDKLEKKGVWETIYPGMSILLPELEEKDNLNSIAIMEVTAQGRARIDLADLCWRSVDGVGVVVPGWTRNCGYWFGTLRRPVTGESLEVREARMANDKLARKKEKKVAALAAKETQRLSQKGAPVKQLEKKTTTIKLHSETRPRPKPKSLVPVKPDKIWTPFNFPMQPDVLLSFLECRKAFNKWRLLGPALGKRAASKKDVKVQRHQDPNERLYRAFIPLDKERHYHPPPPGKTWNSSGFRLEDGLVWFPNAEVARGYTIISFLLNEQSAAMEEWFVGLLSYTVTDFVPHRLTISSRRRDPLNMVVLYDNDEHQTMVPMAVCLKICEGEGVFVLTDDFGRILRDSAYRFEIK
jgi:hypothetical protein